MRILVVCLGNICRSPLAEGLLRKKAPSDSLVDSAGTSGYHHEEPPDHRMIRTARKHGVDIRSLRSRKFEVEDFDRFDLIYAMDSENLRVLKSLARNENDLAKLNLILNEIQPGSNSEVPDPYFGGDDGFEHVYTLLDQATDAIIKKYF
jgi:protein-tyrosine phosphatase